MTHFQATAEVAWQRLPKQPQNTIATVRLSDMRIQPSFTSGPMIQCFLRDISCSAASRQTVSNLLHHALVTSRFICSAGGFEAV